MAHPPSSTGCSWIALRHEICLATPPLIVFRRRKTPARSLAKRLARSPATTRRCPGGAMRGPHLVDLADGTRRGSGRRPPRANRSAIEALGGARAHLAASPAHARRDPPRAAQPGWLVALPAAAL